MNQTDNRYTLLYGLSLFEPDDRTPLCSVEEVADFLLTHDGGIITEPDGAVLLEVEDREFVSEPSRRCTVESPFTSQAASSFL